jgi:hypothetical protein
MVNDFHNSFNFYRWFDRFLTVCIIVNAIISALKNYDYKKIADIELCTPETMPTCIYDKDSVFEQNWYEKYVGTTITVIFILEFVIKNISLGFLLDKGCFLRNGWN